MSYYFLSVTKDRDDHVIWHCKLTTEAMRLQPKADFAEQKIQWEKNRCDEL